MDAPLARAVIDLGDYRDDVTNIDAHVIVYADSFGRFVDPGLFLHNAMNRIVFDHPELSWPLIFGGVDEIPKIPFQAIGTRPPYYVKYEIAASRRVRIESLSFDLDAWTNMERNAFFIAHNAVSNLVAYEALLPERITVESPIFRSMFGPPRSDLPANFEGWDVDAR
ncbi:hypothetical protein [Dactylosporangium sp. CA-233914]|uniref:hypothetical protein n=1 Tax=Dactylosporangium sp. CA-233914 TaxID=3239934 RepID=UPI003D8D36BB